jgi:PPOX class probable F420-dependent enzyme
MTNLSNHKYLCVETYRKTGTPVRTPVWFAGGADTGRLYIYSLADAGKVKRIRNNPRVRIAPCDARGRVLGDWVEATARIEDQAGHDLGMSLLNKRYGLLKRIGDIFSARLMGRKRAVISIVVSPSDSKTARP